MSVSRGKTIVACVVKDGKTSKFSSNLSIDEIKFDQDLIEFGDIYVRKSEISMLDIEHGNTISDSDNQSYPVAITFTSGKTSMVKILDKEKFISTIRTYTYVNNDSNNKFYIFQTDRGIIYINIKDIAVIDFVNI
ncbi:MAG: hypothetical protein PHW28_06605 [Mesotoga sp.]|jgi:hypothetical protein|nr:hypothetical protein [Mesotoga sp.]